MGSPRWRSGVGAKLPAEVLPSPDHRIQGRKVRDRQGDNDQAGGTCCDTVCCAGAGGGGGDTECERGSPTAADCRREVIRGWMQHQSETHHEHPEPRQEGEDEGDGSEEAEEAVDQVVRAHLSSDRHEHAGDDGINNTWEEGSRPPWNHKSLDHADGCADEDRQAKGEGQPLVAGHIRHSG
jgi:hypothetical protein